MVKKSKSNRKTLTQALAKGLFRDMDVMFHRTQDKRTFVTIGASVIIRSTVLPDLEVSLSKAAKVERMNDVQGAKFQAAIEQLSDPGYPEALYTGLTDERSAAFSGATLWAVKPTHPDQKVDVAAFVSLRSNIIREVAQRNTEIIRLADVGTPQTPNLRALVVGGSDLLCAIANLDPPLSRVAREGLEVILKALG